MTEISRIDRRGFLRLTGGVAAAGALVTWTGKVLTPEAFGAGVPPDLYFGGTDGWIHMPEDPPIGFFHPDNLAPEGTGLTTYMFGFRNLTGMTTTQRDAQKYKAQHSAPLFWVKQYDPAHPKDFNLKLRNLGLELRPDLFDAHTLHWHGFRDVIPFYDGEPSGSISVPSGHDFTYVYRPRDPGTYMYHCHVEDVEHVQMGMTGMVFVRPLQDGNTSLYPSGKYLYNDANGSTGFDREYAMFMSEIWAEAHWSDAHIQLPEWSDYRADFSMLNGRVYPDTIAPNASVDPFHPVYDADGDLIPPRDGPKDAYGAPLPPQEYPELKYQPCSSLVNCNAGDRVALRFANLGFREQAMTLAGVRMRVVGRDATFLGGRNRTGDTSYETETLNIGPGESYDVVFDAPAHSGGPGPDVYMLYNRAYERSNNLAPGGFGGQATEVHVHPQGTLGDQLYPNHWGVRA